MKYHKQWLVDRYNAGERLKFLFFWGHQPAQDGTITASCFSQWWAGHPFEANGVPYATAEHYMMAGKARLFGDGEMEQEILRAASPAEAKKLGRSVRNFDPTVWEQHRFEIVVAGNVLKFSQHPALKTYLIQTGERILVEASPRDQIWGIGLGKENERAANPPEWRGLNLLGFALMEVRDRLKEGAQ